MKSGIHPDYHKITVVMTNGTKYETRSTWGKEGDTLQLDVDPNTHPAWQGQDAVHFKKTGRLQKFNDKFGSLGIKGAPTKAAKAEAAPEAKQDGEKSEKKAKKEDKK